MYAQSCAAAATGDAPGIYATDISPEEAYGKALDFARSLERRLAARLAQAYADMAETTRIANEDMDRREQAESALAKAAESRDLFELAMNKEEALRIEAQYAAKRWYAAASPYATPEALREALSAAEAERKRAQEMEDVLREASNVIEAARMVCIERGVSPESMAIIDNAIQKYRLKLVKSNPVARSRGGRG